MKRKIFKFSGPIHFDHKEFDSSLILYNYEGFRFFIHPFKSLRPPKKNSFNYNIYNFLGKYLNLNEKSLIIRSYLFPTTVDIGPIIDFIKNNKIEKIYFFIHDLFRLLYPETNVMDASILEKFPDEVEAEELIIIKKIQESCNVEVMVYYCETYADLFSKKYNIPIKYYDEFTVSVAEGILDEDIKYSIEFEYKISCFNLRPEIYRSCIAALLYKEKDVLLTLNHRYELEKFINNKTLPFNNFSKDIKDKIIENYREILDNNIILSYDVPHQNTFDKMFIDHKDLPENLFIMGNSFVSLVTETRFCSPLTTFGEKTLKPMAMYRPFIMMGAPYTLKLMKDLGFKTFNKYWDESYDNITDHNKRFEEIYKVVQFVLSKSHNDLKIMLGDMQEILEHNKNNFKALRKKMFTIEY